MKIKCIFYDCVGPLLIKNPDVYVSPQVAQIDQLCGSATNDKEFWSEIKKKFHLSLTDISGVVDEIARSYTRNEPMWEFHEKIRSKYKTAVINNGTYTIFKKWIEKYDMFNHFDNLFNSAKLGVRKPDKKIFEICTRQMDVKLSESVLIDDSQYNVDGAIAAGLFGIYYNPLKHSTFISEYSKIVAPK